MKHSYPARAHRHRAKPRRLRFVEQANFHRHTYVLAACLFAPIVLGFVRKFIPGQPAWMRATSILIVALAAIWSFKQRRTTPTWVTAPLFLWAGLQFVYTVPAGFAQPQMLPFTVGIYFIPILLTRVAYVSITDSQQLARIARWFGYLGIALLPLGIIVAVFGNEALPYWLGPTELADADQLGIMRGQFPAPSLLDSTPVAFAHTMLAINILLLVGLELAQSSGKKVGWWWVLIVGSLVLNYLCGRRGVFLASLAGVAYSALRGKEYRVRKLAILGLFFVGVILIDQYGSILGRGVSGRSDIYDTLDFADRFNDIFWRFTSQWIEGAPFGHFLGYSSPFAKSFGVTWEFSVIEVGAAALVADMGVFGLILFPVVTVWIAGQLLAKSRGLACRPAVVQLVIAQAGIFILFYFKAVAFLSIATADHLLFWAIPGIGAALIINERRQRAMAQRRQMARGRDEEKPSAGGASG